MPVARLHLAVRRRTAHWSPGARGIAWACGAGFFFGALNALMRSLTLELHPLQAQFLRYFFGLVVLLPLLAKQGLAAYRPQNAAAQFTRGAVHTLGLCLWFLALPRIPLADTTAIGFTTPLFTMIGALVFFKEPMRWERWLATAAGFAGVLIVVGPRLSGSGGGWHLVMLASAPVFAASFLLTKALTRTEKAGVILFWQALSISLYSLPLAWWFWQPLSAAQWAGFAFCGLLGSSGHYCLTRSFAVAEISATQSAKFLDLVWAALFGFIVFGDLPQPAAVLGGALICGATIWLARRESQGASPAAPAASAAHSPASPGPTASAATARSAGTPAG